MIWVDYWQMIEVFFHWNSLAASQKYANDRPHMTSLLFMISKFTEYLMASKTFVPARLWKLFRSLLTLTTMPARQPESPPFSPNCLITCKPNHPSGNALLLPIRPRNGRRGWIPALVRSWAGPARLPNRHQALHSRSRGWPLVKVHLSVAFLELAALRV